MRILVTGVSGQVGWELNRSLMPLGEIVALDRAQCDLTRPETIVSIIRNVRPNVIVNAAAYTAVDRAEKEEALATLINSTSVGVLAQEAQRSGALLLHYSTDYVFDGTKTTAYTEDDLPNPINAYGRSKLGGETAIRTINCAHIVLRTTWVFASRGQNFLKTILRLAGERPELKIVADQFGAPTSARSIADATAHILRQAIREQRTGKFTSGIFNLAAAGATSWHGFAEAIVRGAARHALLDSTRLPKVTPIPTTDYPLPAPRPPNSRLDVKRLLDRFDIAVSDWERQMDTILAEISGRWPGSTLT